MTVAIVRCAKCIAQKHTPTLRYPANQPAAFSAPGSAQLSQKSYKVAVSLRIRLLFALSLPTDGKKAAVARGTEGR